MVYSINSYGNFRHSLKLITFAVFVSLIFLNKINFPSHALEIIPNTSSLNLGQRFDWDMSPEAAIVVCIYEWSKIQNVQLWRCQPISDWCLEMSDWPSRGFVCFLQRPTATKIPANAREIRKCFGNKQTTDLQVLLKMRW